MKAEGATGPTLAERIPAGLVSIGSERMAGLRGVKRGVSEPLVKPEAKLLPIMELRVGGRNVA